jgi:hypothetical protein
LWFIIFFLFVLFNKKTIIFINWVLFLWRLVYILYLKLKIYLFDLVFWSVSSVRKIIFNPIQVLNCVVLNFFLFRIFCTEHMIKWLLLLFYHFYLLLLLIYLRNLFKLSLFIETVWFLDIYLFDLTLFMLNLCLWMGLNFFD